MAYFRSDRRPFVRIGQVDPDSGSYAYPDGLKIDRNDNLYIGQSSMGRIIVVSPDRKLVKTIDMPSPAAPNLNFCPDEAVRYIMAVDDQNNAPYWGKVYQVANRQIIFLPATFADPQCVLPDKLWWDTRGCSSLLFGTCALRVCLPPETIELLTLAEISSARYSARRVRRALRTDCCYGWPGRLRRRQRIQCSFQSACARVSPRSAAARLHG